MGTLVSAWYAQDFKYYKAKIIECLPDDRFKIEWEDRMDEDTIKRADCMELFEVGGSSFGASCNDADEVLRVTTSKDRAEKSRTPGKDWLTEAGSRLKLLRKARAPPAATAAEGCDDVVFHISQMHVVSLETDSLRQQRNVRALENEVRRCIVLQDKAGIFKERPSLSTWIQPLMPRRGFNPVCHDFELPSRREFLFRNFKIITVDVQSIFGIVPCCPTCASSPCKSLGLHGAIRMDDPDRNDPLKLVLTHNEVFVLISMRHRCNSCNYTFHESDGYFMDTLPPYVRFHFPYEASFNIQGTSKSPQPGTKESRRSVILGRDISDGLAGRVRDSMNWTAESEGLQRQQALQFSRSSEMYESAMSSMYLELKKTQSTGSLRLSSSAEHGDGSLVSSGFFKDRFDNDAGDLRTAYQSMLSLSAVQLQDAFIASEELKAKDISRATLLHDDLDHVDVIIAGDGNHTMGKKAGRHKGWRQSIWYVFVNSVTKEILGQKFVGKFINACTITALALTSFYLLALRLGSSPASVRL